ncbi:hypothetical protein GCM10007877_28470 [Marinibactrum halimedae]|uniref:WD40 repeat domain-containing protein n=1 Tax=Marinibactrum halimedae TaxID=1444977 RepID=A0AA37T4R8_9GAMM|nr:hypothetical protein GCM10007877_28470 [Marinibactrum halimedae]
MDTAQEIAAKGLHSAALSNNGKLGVIGSIYHGGSLWNANGERVFDWNHRQEEPSTFLAVALSPEGNWAVTAERHAVSLWNTQTGRSVGYRSVPGEVLDIALAPDGNFALIGLADFGAILFDVRRGAMGHKLPHTNRVRSVDLSDDGTLAITGSEDGKARLWSVSTGQLLGEVAHDEDVQMVRLSPDGTLALSAAKYDKAVIWRTTDQTIIGEIPLRKEHLKRGIRFTSAEFSTDGKYLLTGRPDHIVQLWNVKTTEEQSSWALDKRSQWKPTSAAVLAVGFDEKRNRYHALASNGFWFTLSQKP